ncbi:phosphatidylserine/phosphatidylglycerophosphate/cardiolipin synthase [Mycolicibacterium chubuense NBB4]|uniref:Phosphatidylserine/phosphatidylglycerophosphate/ cardiolipin synthase n=1 Tax=Mycolicibacterium chubuense (strain NBB4) TaxID=710421 RepID=I4BDX7_MYCCN|nr:phospholipase D-like domain-containing protein [Mycolicibacterium chubuense]AFM15484.1 phosphatidylserine/phosphatidylglycerophosphate/cardiolipin synthase [Mycolicibacterium chubuense NBB4]
MTTAVGQDSARPVESLDGSDRRLLTPGETCWRTAHAERFSHLIDGADYLYHVKSAMLGARRRIMIIGWDLDYRTAFEAPGPSLAGPNHLGPFLHWLVWRRPDLEVYLLKSNLRLLPAFDGFWFGVTPVTLVNRITSPRMHFAVDGAHPTGAVHHQKIVVVDDAVALCGGIDLTLGRWDTRAHRRHDPGRTAAGHSYGPRHEVATAVDDDAAAALAEQARERWHAATGETLDPVTADRFVWPRDLHPAVRDVEVGIARTLPALSGRSEIREVEALNLAAIAQARRVIYLENQYLASRRLAEALAARLREPDGPEIVIILPRSSESRLEQESMDSARERLLRMLWEADEHGRLGVYWPVSDGGTAVYVHSKVMIVDNRLLRIGSSNLNNRSLGFDSECDVALEAVPGAPACADIRTEIVSARDDLVSEHLGVSMAVFREEMARRGSFLATVDALRSTGRSLRRFTGFMVAADVSPFAENDLMDPDHVPASLAQSVGSVVEGLLMWPVERVCPEAASLARQAIDDVAQHLSGVLGSVLGNR